MSHKVKGFAAVITSAIIFGMFPLLAKIVYSNGGTAGSTVFYRFFITVPLFYAYLKYKKVDLSISKKELHQMILLAVIGYGGTCLLLFSSYSYIPLGMATTLHFVYPVFVILGSILFLKERVGAIKLTAVFLCMGGILCFYNGDGSISLLGILLAFSSGITYAFYILYIDKSGLNAISTVKLTMYLNLIACIMALIFCLSTGAFTMDMTALGWGTMILLAVAASCLGVCLFQYGISCVGPQNAAILSTFEPITSVIIGILVLQEHMDLKTAGGCILILTSVLLVSLFSNDKPQKKKG